MPDLEFEKSHMKAGYPVVAGIDEAGRGPLAGPVSAAAVILPVNFTHEVLDDSKKISEKKREAIYKELTTRPDITWAHSFADTQEIEEINILKATHCAMARAAKSLAPTPDFCLIDGLTVPDFPIDSLGIVKGDGKSLSIAAASIIAKVTRDRLMVKYAEIYPEYGFEKHKGYGTKQHMEALRKYGPCPLHRKNFTPVAQLLLPLDASS